MSNLTLTSIDRLALRDVSLGIFMICRPDILVVIACHILKKMIQLLAIQKVLNKFSFSNINQKNLDQQFLNKSLDQQVLTISLSRTSFKFVLAPPTSHKFMLSHPDLKNDFKHPQGAGSPNLVQNIICNESFRGDTKNFGQQNFLYKPIVSSSLGCKKIDIIVI